MRTQGGLSVCAKIRHTWMGLGLRTGSYDSPFSVLAGDWA
jgi:hypothetical protein